MNLAEELVLCAIDVNGHLAAGTGAGAGAAVAVELVLASRVRIGERLEPLDLSPTGDPVLDAVVPMLDEPALLELTPEALLHALWLHSKRHITRSLVERAAVKVVPGGPSPTGIVHPDAYTVKPEGEEPRGRLARALAAHAPPDERTAVLAALVAAAGLVRLHVPRDEVAATEEHVAGFALADGVAPVVEACRAAL